MSHTVGYARWHSHVNAVNPMPAMRAWLTDTTSLTLKLTASSKEFRVRRLRQGGRFCLADEFGALHLPRRVRVQEREVVLQCDGQPMVFAHTIMPWNTSASEWPSFRGLGERSLGTTLFGDPCVVRGLLQYARLQAGHPLMRRASAAVGAINQPLYARRCIYRRKRGVLLVTEVFLPAIAEGLQMGKNESNKQSI